MSDCIYFNKKGLQDSKIILKPLHLSAKKMRSYRLDTKYDHQGWERQGGLVSGALWKNEITEEIWGWFGQTIDGLPETYRLIDIFVDYLVCQLHCLGAFKFLENAFKHWKRL